VCAGERVRLACAVMAFCFAGALWDPGTETGLARHKFARKTGLSGIGNRDVCAASPARATQHDILHLPRKRCPDYVTIARQAGRHHRKTGIRDAVIRVIMRARDTEYSIHKKGLPLLHFPLAGCVMTL